LLNVLNAQSCLVRILPIRFIQFSRSHGAATATILAAFAAFSGNENLQYIRRKALIALMCRSRIKLKILVSPVQSRPCPLAVTFCSQ
jgi:hypothetical protein